MKREFYTSLLLLERDKNNLFELFHLLTSHDDESERAFILLVNNDLFNGQTLWSKQDHFRDEPLFSEEPSVRH
jgi:hypothetical protein